MQNNQAHSSAGIYVGIGTLTIAETCRITRNVASSLGGGGIGAGTRDQVTLQGVDPSPIVVDNCPDNCSPSGFVAKCAATPVFCPS